MKYEIKRATIDNIKSANALLTKLIIDEKKYDKNINEKCVVSSLYENLIKNDNNFICFAMANDFILGYIFGFIKDNGDAYINPVTQLDAMYVEEKYRNLGIGNALINEFKKWSKDVGASIVELKVCNDNKEAIALYKKNNFKEVKTIMECNIEEGKK